MNPNFACKKGMNLDIKVAIYEDNDALRESLTYLIKGSGLLRSAGAYSDCRAILENCESERPDVVLLSLIHI